MVIATGEPIDGGKYGFVFTRTYYRSKCKREFFNPVTGTE